MFHPQILVQITDLVSTKEKTDAIIAQAKKCYDINQFNVVGLYPKIVRKLCDSLNKRYSKQEIQLLPFNWNQGQRRLFVWFILCFMHLKNVKLQEITEKDLQSLSPIFHGKDPQFLDFQLKNLPKASRLKNVWSEQQDQILISIIDKKNQIDSDDKIFKNWNQVAKLIYFKTEKKIFKTPKACRERWYNHLDTSKKRDQFTIQEDLKLINFIIKESKSWSKIVKIMNYTRTEHRIKNRFYTLIRKFQKISPIQKGLEENSQKFLIREIKKALVQNKNKYQRIQDIPIFRKYIDDQYTYEKKQRKNIKQQVLKKQKPLVKNEELEAEIPSQKQEIQQKSEKQNSLTKIKVEQDLKTQKQILSSSELPSLKKEEPENMEMQPQEKEQCLPQVPVYNQMWNGMNFTSMQYYNNMNMNYYPQMQMNQLYMNSYYYSTFQGGPLNNEGCNNMNYY